MKKELVMYSRTTGCPFVTLAKRVLHDYDVPFREVMIDKDPVARQRVKTWTGFLAVPTLVAAVPGSDLPYTDFAPLPEGASPRGVHRGPMLTEPGMAQLIDWLQEQGFIEALDIHGTQTA